MVDIDSKKIVGMLDSRDTEKVEEWLNGFPNIEIVSRDGSLSYANSVNNANPEIIQISDRFHILKNLTEYSKKAINRVLGNKKIYLIEDTVNEVDVTEKINLTDSEINKNEIIEEVKKLFSKGYSKTSISKQFNLNRQTVSNYIKQVGKFTHGARNNNYNSILYNYKTDIEKMVLEGKKGTYIIKCIKNDGYTGSESNIRKYIGKVKKREHKGTIKKEILKKDIISLLYRNIDKIDIRYKEDLKSYLNNNNLVSTIITLSENFKKALFSKNPDKLDDWIRYAKEFNIDEINSFINGLERDIEAVRNAIKFKYNNGLAEGTVNKIKVIKRIMYGRGSLKLLQNKLMQLQEIY